MKRTIRIQVLLTTLTAVTPAFARTIPATAGMPQNTGDQCFVQSDSAGNQARGQAAGAGGSVAQEGASFACGGTHTFCVPLTIDWAGSHSVSVNATSSHVSCIATATDPNGFVVGRSNRNALTFDGQPFDIALDPVNVPPAGSLSVCCDMEPNSVINLIKWNP
jgi:hypothetical protein